MENNIFELTGSQRAALRKAGHSLDPVVMVGGDGLSEGVIAATKTALADHELIKVKFQDFKEERRGLSEQLAAAAQAQFIALRGNVLLLFRQDPEDSRFRLPKRS